MVTAKIVLVTGSSGYIAKHIVQQLLDQGYQVRGSVRSMSRAAEVLEAVAANVRDRSDLEQRLQFVELDLNSDHGWDDALAGVGAVLHTASPFPMVQPDNEEALITPAVDGTLRALTAAQKAGVHRVVLTSSVAAVSQKKLESGRSRYDERDWSDIHSPTISAYSKSKTLAEKAAWSFVKEHPEMQLTTINPGFVLGTPLDGHFGTSMQVIKRILQGRDLMVPNIGFPIVDVRNIAQMHVRALTTPASIGRRFIGAERFMWMVDLARILKQEYPHRKIATRVAPDWLMRLIGRFDKAIAGILPLLGNSEQMDNTAAQDVLEIEFIDVRQSVKASAAYVVRHHLVE